MICKFQLRDGKFVCEQCGFTYDKPVTKRCSKAPEVKAAVARAKQRRSCNCNKRRTKDR